MKTKTKKKNKQSTRWLPHHGQSYNLWGKKEKKKEQQPEKGRKKLWKALGLLPWWHSLFDFSSEITLCSWQDIKIQLPTNLKWHHQCCLEWDYTAMNISISHQVSIKITKNSNVLLSKGIWRRFFSAQVSMKNERTFLGIPLMSKMSSFFSILLIHFFHIVSLVEALFCGLSMTEYYRIISVENLSFYFIISFSTLTVYPYSLFWKSSSIWFCSSPC